MEAAVFVATQAVDKAMTPIADIERALAHFTIRVPVQDYRQAGMSKEEAELHSNAPEWLRALLDERKRLSAEISALRKLNTAYRTGNQRLADSALTELEDAEVGGDANRNG